MEFRRVGRKPPRRRCGGFQRFSAASTLLSSMAAGAAIVGCTSILGIDKDYVEGTVAPGPVDASPDQSVKFEGGQAEVATRDAGPPPPVIAISAALSSTCALLQGGEVWCWGNNDSGELGDGTTQPRLRPVTTKPLGKPAVAITVGGDAVYGAHTCALFAPGDGASCWGAGAGGALGQDDAGAVTEPVPINGISSSKASDGGGAVAVSAGARFSCATHGGNVSCWGTNEAGELGDDTNDSRTTAGVVVSLGEIGSLASGSRHSCAVTNDGAFCWGLNSSGQLGIYGYPPTSSSRPLKVYNSGAAVLVTAGVSHSCMLRNDGRVLCWGSNSSGQIGNGNNNVKPTPEGVSGLPNNQALNVTAGGRHTCAIVDGGAVYCWGSNGSGELGDGTTADSNVAKPVRNLTGAKALALGFNHTCALLEGGTVKCWGAGGRLGDGTENAASDPVQVSFAYP